MASKRSCLIFPKQTIQHISQPPCKGQAGKSRMIHPGPAGTKPGSRQGTGTINGRIIFWSYAVARVMDGLPWWLRQSRIFLQRGRPRGSIPGLGRSPEEGMVTHSSILAWRIPIDRGAWWATVHGVAKNRTRSAIKHSPE